MTKKGPQLFAGPTEESETPCSHGCRSGAVVGVRFLHEFRKHATELPLLLRPFLCPFPPSVRDRPAGLPAGQILEAAAPQPEATAALSAAALALWRVCGGGAAAILVRPVVRKVALRRSGNGASAVDEATRGTSFVFEPSSWGDRQLLHIEASSPRARERLSNLYQHQQEREEQQQRRFEETRAMQDPPPPPQEQEQAQEQALPTSLERLRTVLAYRQGEIVTLRSDDLDEGVDACSDWRAGAAFSGTCCCPEQESHRNL